MIIMSIYIFLIGLCIGSFLNVVILRAFSGESIVFPPSKCPKCQNKLKWWHNIPILSYLFLRGKCAFCGEKISLQYPIVEFLTAIGFVAIFWKFQFTLNTLFMFFFLSLFIIISATDIKEKVAFNYHTMLLIIGGLIYGCLGISHLNINVTEIFNFEIPTHIISTVFGGIIGFVGMEILARIGYLFSKSRAFGEADSYIMAGLGTIFGLENLFYIFLCAIILTIPIFLIKTWQKKDYQTFFGLIIFAVIYFIGKLSDIINIFGFKIFLIYSLLLSGVGLYLCITILQKVKKAEISGDATDLNSDKITFLPFGPLLFAGGIIFIFFGM